MQGEWLNLLDLVSLHGGSKVMRGGQFNGGRKVMLQRWSI